MKEDQSPSPWQITCPFYGRKLVQELEGKPRSKHIVIMADGNRRWVREVGFTDVSHGHRAGSRKTAEFVGWCIEQEIELIVIYLLSTENLGRDPEELEPLFDITADVVDEPVQSPNDVCLRMIGHLESLLERMITRLYRDGEVTTSNTSIQVNIAVGYGGRQEAVDAVRKVTRESVTEGIGASELGGRVTTDVISCRLYTSGQPDPDLVIRTPEGQRLSGFLS